jgi:hypothetical protein
MQTTILARQRDQAGQRTLCMLREAGRYQVAVIPRPGQLLPFDDGVYDAYEAAWQRLCEACEPAHEEV